MIPSPLPCLFFFHEGTLKMIVHILRKSCANVYRPDKGDMFISWGRAVETCTGQTKVICSYPEEELWKRVQARQRWYIHILRKSCGNVYRPDKGDSWERSSIITELVWRNFICKELICVHTRAHTRARTHAHTPLVFQNCNLSPLQFWIYYKFRIWRFRSCSNSSSDTGLQSGVLSIIVPAFVSEFCTVVSWTRYWCGTGSDSFVTFVFAVG
jgi:rubredoxin